MPMSHINQRVVGPFHFTKINGKVCLAQILLINKNPTKKFNLKKSEKTLSTNLIDNLFLIFLLVEFVCQS